MINFVGKVKYKIPNPEKYRINCKDLNYYFYR